MNEALQCDFQKIVLNAMLQCQHILKSTYPMLQHTFKLIYRAHNIKGQHQNGSKTKRHNLSVKFSSPSRQMAILYLSEFMIIGLVSGF